MEHGNLAVAPDLFPFFRLETDFYVLEAEGAEEGGELGLGALLGLADVGGREASLAHLASGFLVHLFFGSGVPGSALVEGSRACLVDEVLGEELDGG